MRVPMSNPSLGTLTAAVDISRLQYNPVKLRRLRHGLSLTLAHPKAPCHHGGWAPIAHHGKRAFRHSIVRSQVNVPSGTLCYFTNFNLLSILYQTVKELCIKLPCHRCRTRTDPHPGSSVLLALPLIPIPHCSIRADLTVPRSFPASFGCLCEASLVPYTQIQNAAYHTARRMMPPSNSFKKFFFIIFTLYS